MLTAARRYPPAAVRLAGKLVKRTSECLEWTGATNRGYGQLAGDDKKVVKAHRLAWSLANGPIPDGLHVLHHCDNPPCCETDPTESYPEGHLFLGTPADNSADKVAKGRARGPAPTRCPDKHPYDEANTYVNPTTGSRSCRICRQSRQRKRSEGVILAHANSVTES
jgi:hypothetical protein